ncbi:hypothetical protein JCM11641_004278 [Rhodosporidiobolus odoratus]
MLVAWLLAETSGLASNQLSRSEAGPDLGEGTQRRPLEGLLFGFQPASLRLHLTHLFPRHVPRLSGDSAAVFGCAEPLSFTVEEETHIESQVAAYLDIDDDDYEPVSNLDLLQDVPPMPARLLAEVRTVDHLAAVWARPGRAESDARSRSASSVWDTSSSSYNAHSRVASSASSVGSSTSAKPCNSASGIVGDMRKVPSAYGAIGEDAPTAEVISTAAFNPSPSAPFAPSGSTSASPLATWANTDGFSHYFAAPTFTLEPPVRQLGSLALLDDEDVQVKPAPVAPLYVACPCASDCDFKVAAKPRRVSPFELVRGEGEAFSDFRRRRQDHSIEYDAGRVEVPPSSGLQHRLIITPPPFLLHFLA